MPLDRRTWQERITNEESARAAQQRAALAIQRLAQAAVPLERLTGSDHWDTFLRLGEKRQVADRTELAELSRRILGAGWVSPAELAALRHRAVVLTAAIDARQELLDLPRSILQEARDSTQ
jgi:hypothetical protein